MTMKTKTIFLAMAVLLPFLTALADEQQERMMWASINKASNASLGDYQQHTGKILVSWRMLPGESWNTAFDLYRRGISTSRKTKINTAPITKATCFQDPMANPQTGYIYQLTYAGQTDVIAQCTIQTERVKDGLPYVSIPLKSTEDVFDPKVCVYTANDVSVGDLDGDGIYDIVVKRLQSRVDADGNVTSDGTGAGYQIRECPYPVIWDAYKLDGTFLWRIKGGTGIMLGNSSSFAVVDFDGDGCAEMAIRTVEGTVFGDGTEIGDVDGDGKTDYRTWGNQNTSSPGWVDHYCSAGPEFLSIIDGRTGAELARTNYIPRETSESWGDNYWKRANSHRIGVGCFDETGLPSVVVGRGVYARTVIEAWDWRDGQLTRRFHFDSSAPGGTDTNKDGKPNSAYTGQGNHSLNVADLDGDGVDEIMYGSMALDNDGYGLWSTRLGHGDANHVGKFLPDREGLQVWHCLEGGTTMVAMHDAKDGKTIWNKVSSTANDCGRCMVADIDPSSPGCEFWWAGSNAHSATGQDLGYKPSSCNAGIWFDGSLSRQLLDANTIQSPAHGRTFTMYRYSESFINGSKSNPSWYGDLVGDWREEVIVPDGTKLVDLKVFSTWYPTEHKFPYLMSDHTYLMSCLNENIGYNQPTNLGWYLGSDLKSDDEPFTTTAIRTVSTAAAPKADVYFDLQGRRVAQPSKGLYIKNGRKVVVK